MHGAEAGLVLQDEEIDWCGVELLGSNEQRQSSVRLDFRCVYFAETEVQEGASFFIGSRAHRGGRIIEDNPGLDCTKP